MTPFSVNLILDCRHQKKDGTYSIKFRVIVERKPFHISAGYAVLKTEWQESAGKIKPRSKSLQNITRINNLLQKRKAQYTETLIRLEEEGQLERLPLKEIKSLVQGKPSKLSTLYLFFEEVIADMNRSGRVGNARVYQLVLSSIQNFMGQKDVSFKHITYRWLQKYEAWYLGSKDSKGKPNTRGGLSVNMRTLRALYNKAIKSGLVNREHYPFSDYKILSAKTRKRAIKLEDIAKIKALDDGLLTKRQRLAKDYFLMSFYLMGVSFVDLAFLTHENIVDSRIEYTRRKTGQLHSIKITEPLETLLGRYLIKNAGSGTLLGVVKGRTEEARYTQARDELRRYNRSLKQLGEMVGLSAPITSYTARHSYATIAKSKNVPVAVISEALGHETIEMTQTYLAEFETDVLDRYNEVIIAM